MCQHQSVRPTHPLGFSALGRLRGESPDQLKILLISHLEQFRRSRLSPPCSSPIKCLFRPTKSHSSHAKWQYPSYNPTKTAFSETSHCSCWLQFVLISYSLDTCYVILILILFDVQYSQKAVFSFQKGSNSRIVKITPPQVPFTR